MSRLNYHYYHEKNDSVAYYILGIGSLLILTTLLIVYGINFIVNLLNITI